jgi:putative transposase
MNKAAYDQLKAKALSQFRSGKSLFSKGGAFAPLLKQFLDEALNAEMEAHLKGKEREKGNKRNGMRKKTVKTSAGNVSIERDDITYLPTLKYAIFNATFNGFLTRPNQV